MMAATPDRCVALVATKNRWDLLLHRSLASIRRQLVAPEVVVLVNDGVTFEPDAIAGIRDLLAPIPVAILSNGLRPGAAGAWNTGLQYLQRAGFAGYVAILDDDDDWDDVHLSVNMARARETGAQIVVSGLRRLVDGVVTPRPLPDDLRDRNFLCGNPGLQGSNTFVSLATLKQVGGFTNGLPSLNDRDLALRLLRVPGIRIAYTRQWTASWHHGCCGDALSTPRSPAKIEGLRWFWRLYGAEMNSGEAFTYFDRAYRMFGVDRHEIVGAAAMPDAGGCR